MIKFVSKKIIIFTLFFTTYKSIYGEGFIKGTLIKTKQGYIPVEQLKENDSVLTYNYRNKLKLEDKIQKIEKKQYKKAVRIVIDGTMIITAPDHKFFCPLRKGNWIIAQDLHQDDFILKNIINLGKIEKIDVINYEKEFEFYNLSMNENHNYFVTEKDIFVHNSAIGKILKYLFGKIGEIIINRETIIIIVLAIVEKLGDLIKDDKGQLDKKELQKIIKRIDPNTHKNEINKITEEIKKRLKNKKEAKKQS